MTFLCISYDGEAYSISRYFDFWVVYCRCMDGCSMISMMIILCISNSCSSRDDVDCAIYWKENVEHTCSLWYLMIISSSVIESKTKESIYDQTSCSTMRKYHSCSVGA